MNELLLLPDTNVNVLTWDHKTAFDIADGMPLSEESLEIKDWLVPLEQKPSLVKPCKQVCFYLIGSNKS